MLLDFCGSSNNDDGSNVDFDSALGWRVAAAAAAVSADEDVDVGVAVTAAVVVDGLDVVAVIALEVFPAVVARSTFCLFLF